MLLGLDIGTSSVKASILDPESMKCVASANAPDNELPRTAKQPGWTEQEPLDWWQATVAAIRKLPHLDQVTAVGIGYQMHGLVLIDDTGLPVRPSIIWSDARAVDYGAKIAREIGPDAVNDLLNEPGNFTLAKLRWVRDNEPETLARAWKALLPGDYVAFQLTGEAVTTTAGLSEMMAWNHRDRAPSDAAWLAAEGKLTLRPNLVPILGEQGRVTSRAATETGLPVGCPVTYRAGDQPNNAFSLGVSDPSILAAVAGTSGVLYGVSSVPSRDPHNRVNSFVHVTDSPGHPSIGILMCVNGAGSSYSWLRRLLGISFEDLNRLAASVPAGAEGMSVLPFGNGAERLLGNRVLGARTHHVDFTKHQAGHWARATLEAVAMTLRVGLDVMQSLGVRAEVVRAGDASMFRSPLFSQIVADVLRCRVDLCDTDGSLGAARAAGLGSGLFATDAAATQGLHVTTSFAPGSSGQYEEIYVKWKMDLDNAIAMSNER